MAIKEMNNPKHFVGLSVRRMAGGVRYQRYYNFRTSKGKEISEEDKEYLRKKANDYDEELKILQDISKQTRKELAIPDKSTKDHHYTGVRGIQMKMNITKRKDKVHMYPMFIVFVTEGQKSFFLNTLGRKKAWELACKELTRLKNINSYKHLLERIPSEEDIEKMRKIYFNSEEK